MTSYRDRKFLEAEKLLRKNHMKKRIIPLIDLKAKIKLNSHLRVNCARDPLRLF
ncbi:hypothetical protein MCGE09_00516 [Thaumarchaeota archaeon SCGC AB-539-E09]|nr:hypothetical protein MCGE09_00516 [Thaumarchaeota archaeon SCGC AB-539-E09]